MITPTAMNQALTTRLSLMRVPPMRTWARRLARGPDDMRVGSAAHVHVEGFTCVSRGLRAYQGVYAHTQGLTCERTMWLSGRYHPGHAPDNVREQPIPPGTAQDADHFVTSSPLAVFFTELVCTFGAAAFRQAPRRGELRHPRLRHAGDTPMQRFAWRKSPTATSVGALQGWEG